MGRNRRPRSDSRRLRAAFSCDESDERLRACNAHVSAAKLISPGVPRPPGLSLVTVRYKSGDLYEGELLDGRRHGWGRFHWLHGDKYTGEWRCGRMDGRGSFQWSNGTVYIGSWREGCMDGPGEKVLPNSDRYTGEWHGGSLESGRLVTHSGSEYSGSFADSEFHGFGRMHHADGSFYSGAWCRGAYDGYGRLCDAEGVVSSGEWRLGRLDGVASQVDERRGLRFLGSFERGVREGEGTLTLVDSGSECWGEWHGNRLNGIGRVKCVGERTKTYSGVLSAGQANGSGRCEYGNGDLFEGCFRRNQRSGRGVYRWSNGWTFAGLFREGVPEGSGRLYRGVEEWCGEMRGGLREGVGLYGVRVGDGARVWWRLQRWRANELLVQQDDESWEMEWEGEAPPAMELEPTVEKEEEEEEEWEEGSPALLMVGGAPLPFLYFFLRE